METCTETVLLKSTVVDYTSQKLKDVAMFKT